MHRGYVLVAIRELYHNIIYIAFTMDIRLYNTLHNFAMA